MFSPTLFLRKKALEPNPNIYKYFWDLPGAGAQKYLSSSRLDPLSLNDRSWLECFWKLWTPNRSLCMQSCIGSSSVFMCSGVGEGVTLKKNPSRTINFCYFIILKGLWTSQGIAGTIWYILGLCHQELPLQLPLGRWAEHGGGRRRGFLSTALCRLHVLVPSSVHFILVFLSPFHVMCNL